MKLPSTFKLLLPLVLLLGFVLLSKYEDRSFVRAIDYATTVKVQDRIDSSKHLRTAAVVDTIMQGSSFFASPVFTSVVTLFLTGFVWKMAGARALLVPIVFVLIVAIELIAKSAVHHPSPPFSMIKHATTMFPADYINEQFSYPSGHAARSIYIVLVSWFVLKRRVWWGIGLAFYVVLVSVSRIYLGHHWLSDVLAGLLLGGGMGLFLLVLLFYRARKLDHPDST